MDTELLNQKEIGTCSICNKELSLFGSKQLKDGVICRDCVKLISEWFTDEQLARKSVKSIKNHLKHREENQKALELFNPNITVKGKYSLYIDTVNRKFSISKKTDLLQANADVYNLSAIRELSIIEEKYEDTDNLDVYVEIRLFNADNRKIRFRVNEFPGLEKGSEQHFEAKKLANDYIQALMSKGGLEFNRLQFRRG